MNFCPKKPIEYKNPSGIAAIPDGFHDGSKQIETIGQSGYERPICSQNIPQI